MPRSAIRNACALLCLVAILSACAGSQATGTPAVSSPSAGPSLSPDAQLDAALASFADGYDFITEVTLEDVVATHGEGRRVGEDSETVVGAGESQVLVRTVGTQAWTRKPGEDWVAVDEPADAIDQIAALREPTVVRATAPIDGMPAFVATYPPGALGLTGADIGSVIIQVHPDGTVEVTYEVPLQNGSAVSHTLFSTLTDPTPIVAPG